MRFLDMTPYRPFRPMGTTCLKRPIREKQVIWRRPEPTLHRNGRFMGRLPELKDVAAAAELWRQAYPEIYGSAHDFLLFPEEIPGKVALAETWEADALTKPCLMLVAEEMATGRLGAATLMTKYDRNLQIEYTFAGTHPEFRRQGLMTILGSMMHRTVLASGAEYLTTFLETWHTITQAHTLKRGQGWKIAGIFPGNFTRWAGDQKEYRACEIYLYKFTNEGEKYATQPAEWHLHPDLAKLWNVMEEINQRLADES